MCHHFVEHAKFGVYKIRQAELRYLSMLSVHLNVQVVPDADAMFVARVRELP